MISLIPVIGLLTSAMSARDSIYSLAVDSARYPQEQIVWLLDYGALKREMDGRGTTTYRTVVQILKPEAAQRLQEQAFSYSPGHERLTINWIRVVKPNGDVISEAPTHVQDADIPATLGDPVYSDRKVKRVSLTGVAAGTIVDYSYTREELKPFLAGDFFTGWRITPGTPVMRSYFTVDVPSEMKLHIRERNLNFARSERKVDGRRILTWSATNIAPLKAEPFTPDTIQPGMFIDLSGPVEWKDVARWYADNARNRYEPTENLKQKVAEVVSGARTLDDSIVKVHRWVAQDIRYVAIALGLGGYQPRLPDSVLKSGYGDCKDKATIFITAVKLFGVKAYPVILNSRGLVSESVPSISQFDHVIVAFDVNGRRKYADMTAELYRIEMLPSGYQGAFGLLVHPDGSSEQIRFPASAAEDNQIATRITGELSENGSFSGWVEQTGLGVGEGALRGLFRVPPDSARRVNLRNGFARTFFRDADADSIEVFNGKDFSARPVFRVRLTSPRGADLVGSALIMPLPPGFSGNTRFANIAKQLETEPKRTMPFDLKEVVGILGSMNEMEITLPSGWNPKLPANSLVSGIGGTYTSTYSHVGKVLVIKRSLVGTRGVVSKEKLADILDWMRSTAKDDARFIVIERSPQAQ